MKKKGFFVGMAILLLVVLFGACSDGTATEPEEASNDTSISAESSDDSTVETEDVDMYNFAVVGGAIHPYFDNFPVACVDVGSDLDIPEPVYKAPQDWEQSQQNTILDGLAVQGYSGMCICPTDPVGGNEAISKIAEKGIDVIAVAIAPELPSDALFCLATDTEASAYLATTTLIESMNGEGNIVHLAGQLTDANTAKRMAGVERAVAENPGCTLIQTIADIDSAEASQNAVDALMASSRDEIDGVVCTAWVPSVTITNKLVELDDKRIKLVCNDIDPIVLNGIKDGYVVATTSQNPYMQVYIGVYSLKLLQEGYTWKESNDWFIDSGYILLMKQIVRTLWMF